MRLTPVLAALLCFASVAGRAAEAHLLANAGFEGVYSNGVANGWRKFPIRGLVRGSFAESVSAHTGAKAQQLEVTEAMGAWLQCSAPLAGGIVAGHDYEAAVWLKGNRILENTALMIHDSTAWFPVAHAETSITVDQEWRQVVLRFRARRTDPKALFGVKLVQEGQLFIDDASVRELSSADRPGASAGNLIRNGSFEAGLANWIPYWANARLISDPKAPHGNSVLELPGGGPGRELQSAAIFAPWGRQYTLSLFLRAAQPVDVKASLRHGKTAFAEQVFKVGKSWQRCTLTCDVPPLPDGFFHLGISPGPSVIFVDAVQLEPGSAATPFAPREPIEGALNISNTIASSAQQITATAVFYNAGSHPIHRELNVRVSDYRGNEASVHRLDVNLPPGRSEWPIDLTPAARTGWFRAELQDRAAPKAVVAEKAFAVLPGLPSNRANMAPLGVQVDYGGSPLMARMGATWTKTWLLNWSSMESKTGEWRFPRDATVDHWIADGLTPLAVLSEAPSRLQLRPTNALGWGWYPPRDYAQQTEYARRAAEHYKGRISAWELQNEPDHALHPPKGQRSAAVYAREALALAEGVRAAQDKARILLGGGVTMNTDPEKWLAESLVAQPRLKELCDVFSYHNYTADPEVTRRVLKRIRATMQEHGWVRPIWDTEWNATDSVASAYRQSPRHLSTKWVTSRRAAALTVHGFVSRFGEGIEQTFLYQAYGPGSMQTSEFDVFQEADGAPRPALVACAVLASKLAGAKPAGPVEVPGCWAYRFTRENGKSMLIVWARDTTPGAKAALSIPGAWRITDLMGHDLGPLTNKTIITDDPVYLE